jgi:hypothetical protein
MNEDAARREVRRAVEARGGRVTFARAAGVDPGTLSDFIDGTRWPHAKTRTKIEQALGWDAGRITDLAEGVAEVGTVEDAVRADPTLLPEAKDHILNQLKLLRRLQSAPPPVPDLRDLTPDEVEARQREVARRAGRARGGRRPPQRGANGG